MNTLNNKFDSLEHMIFSKEIKIVKVDIHPEIDLFIVILNSGAIIKQKISVYKLLVGQSLEDLKKIEIIAKGTGIHWIELDEDISLKGLLMTMWSKMVLRIG